MKMQQSFAQIFINNARRLPVKTSKQSQQVYIGKIISSNLTSTCLRHSSTFNNKKNYQLIGGAGRQEKQLKSATDQHSINFTQNRCVTAVPAESCCSDAFGAFGDREGVQVEKCPVSTWNEWDPLEEVIVGMPDNAVVPPPTSEVKACSSSNQWSFFEANKGRFWHDVIGAEHWGRIQQEIDNFVKCLESEGVKVRRPEPVNFEKEFSTPNFESKGLYCCMPRDILLVVGNEIIEATMTWRSRFFEYISYRPLLREYWRQGAMWTAAPKPEADERLIDEHYEATTDEERSKLAENNRYVTTEFEPCFDAADFLRCGEDLFVQRSQVTNLAGIEWVRRHLEPKGIRVHQLNFYDPRPMHIDATFSFVRPGFALQNPDRPCRQADLIRAAGWKVVNSPKPISNIGHTYWLGSKWLMMNTLMLGPDRVFVEEGEKDLHEVFRSHGVEPIPLRLKHANSIGGGFHCWTADIRRKGKLECYFDWENVAKHVR